MRTEALPQRKLEIQKAGDKVLECVKDRVENGGTPELIRDAAIYFITAILRDLEQEA